MAGLCKTCGLFSERDSKRKCNLSRKGEKGQKWMWSPCVKELSENLHKTKKS